MVVTVEVVVVEGGGGKGRRLAAVPGRLTDR